MRFLPCHKWNKRCKTPLATCLSALLCIFMTLQLCADDPNISPPYPFSSHVLGINFDWGSKIRLANGSDNWPVCWASNGKQYSVWGDGGGFAGDNHNGRVSLGVAEITGSFGSFMTRGVMGDAPHYADHDASFTGKSRGILAISQSIINPSAATSGQDDSLFMWVGPGSNTAAYAESRMYQSDDLGASWTAASWAIPESLGIVQPTIIQFGQGYEGARDGYVYSYFIELQAYTPGELEVQNPGRIHLLRVPVDQVMTESAYEVFNGIDSQNNPQWSSDLSQRQPVLEDSNGVGFCLSVSYNPGLGRYLLCTEHTETMRANIGIFDAPEPWGPWTTVLYEEQWGFGLVQDSSFFWNFSNKWLSADGLDFTMIFTGVGQNDSFNALRGEFVVPVGPQAMLGDMDHSGELGINDAVILLNFLFSSGPAPDPISIADSNQDNNVNIADAEYLLNFLFQNGPEPQYN